MTEQLLGHGPECQSYLPGQRLHWSVYKRASSAPAFPVTRVVVDNTSVVVTLEGRAPLHWRHHDPKRMAFAVEHSTGPILACPDERALRVDGYWFNCAPQEAFLPACG